MITDITLVELGLSARDSRTAVPGKLEHLVPEALALRAGSSVPFWTSLMLAAMRNEVSIPLDLVHAASFHVWMAEHARIKQVPRDAVNRERLEVLVEGLSPSRGLLMSSAVGTAEGRQHIPMLDFRAHVGAANLESVTRVVEQLQTGGVILDSGRSYHFYGVRLVDEESWRRMLGQALLLAPLVDERWVAHQLIEGSCALRVSRSLHTGAFPKVVGYVSPSSGG
jgi:hypothetical protein